MPGPPALSTTYQPYSVAVTHPHRKLTVLQAFHSDEESWMSGGDEPCPAFFTIIRPDDPISAKEAFDELRHFLSMLEAFGRLLSLLPGTDLLEVES